MCLRALYRHGLLIACFCPMLAVKRGLTCANMAMLYHFDWRHCAGIVRVRDGHGHVRIMLIMVQVTRWAKGVCKHNIRWHRAQRDWRKVGYRRRHRGPILRKEPRLHIACQILRVRAMGWRRRRVRTMPPRGNVSSNGMPIQRMGLSIWLRNFFGMDLFWHKNTKIIRHAPP